MLINQANLTIVFNGFKAAFNKGFESAPSVYKRIAMTIPSTSREETYGWLGQVAKMREWIGPRVVTNLVAHGYTIKNRDFEQTVGVPRNDIMDDKYGLLAPFVTDMGRAAAEMPDELALGLLKSGFTGLCYDGQYFFDTDHPVVRNQQIVSVSNFQGGSGTPWFLLDTTKPVRPIVYQERMPLGVLVSKTNQDDDNVFWNKEFIYGSDGRCNAGYGLWQLAYASKEDLTAENYEAARAAMRNLKGDEDRPLNIVPDVLVCGPSLEGAAMRLLNNGTRIVTVGEDNLPVAVQNEWAKTAEPMVSQWVA